MGGVINLIKKLFSGIFSFIGGIFGGKKSGYYMELDEVEAAKNKFVAKAVEKKDEVVEDAKAAVAAVSAATKSAVDSATDSAKDAAESVKETVATTEKTAKSTVKSAKAKVKAEKAEPVKAPSAETNGSTNGAKPVSAPETLNLPQPTVSFATEYLVPKPTNSRRRPGANMGSFLEMAKTVKTPNN